MLRQGNITHHEYIQVGKVQDVGLNQIAMEIWETRWDEEQAHIRSLRGIIFETLLSLQFFIFQYGIVYKLHATGNDTSLKVYAWSWIVLAGLILIFKVCVLTPNFYSP